MGNGTSSGQQNPPKLKSLDTEALNFSNKKTFRKQSLLFKFTKPLIR